MKDVFETVLSVATATLVSSSGTDILAVAQNPSHLLFPKLQPLSQESRITGDEDRNTENLMMQKS